MEPPGQRQQVWAQVAGPERELESQQQASQRRAPQEPGRAFEPLVSQPAAD